jgi:hypothetical protein
MNVQTKIAAAYIDQTRPEDSYSKMDPVACVSQIGKMNVAAISGGRVCHTDYGVYLPVSRGYWVSVHLASDDTYIVRRVIYRNHTGKVKEEWRNVYADMVGEIAYQASLFDN